MRPIEFYTTPEGEVTLRPTGESERQLQETDTEFIQQVLSVLSEFYPKAYAALMDTYSSIYRPKRYRDFLAVRRFIKCNFGLYDNMVDLDENWNFRFEFISCPMRGECKYDRIICSPEFDSKLSDRQLEVMKLLSNGTPDHKVADILCLSVFTVNNHRKNSFKKLGIHSMPDFMRFASQNNLFKSKH